MTNEPRNQRPATGPVSTFISLTRQFPVSEFAPSSAESLLNSPRLLRSAQICRSTCASLDLAHVRPEKYTDIEAVAPQGVEVRVFS